MHVEDIEESGRVLLMRGVGTTGRRTRIVIGDGGGTARGSCSTPRPGLQDPSCSLQCLANCAVIRKLNLLNLLIKASWRLSRSFVWIWFLSTQQQQGWR